MKNIVPCYGCGEREMNCHSVCDRYKEFKERKEQTNQQNRKEKEKQTITYLEKKKKVKIFNSWWRYCMTKYELRNYRDLREELNYLQEQITELRLSMTAPKNQVITGMPSGSSAVRDKIGEVVAKVERLEKRYIKKYYDLLSRLEQIENEIDKLEPKERLIIRYKYIQGMTWEDVAEKMSWSVSKVHKAHKKILQKISKNT